MVKEIQLQLTEYGVPRYLLRRFSRVAEAKVKVQHQSELEQYKWRLQQAQKEASSWQRQYLKERKRTEKLEALLAAHDAHIKKLEEIVAKQSAYITDLRKQTFGSKSERNLSQNNNIVAVELTPDKPKLKPGKQFKTPGHGRKFDPDLPVEPIQHDLDDKDKSCRCGEEYEFTDLPPLVSYEVHLEQHIIVRQHIRRKSLGVCTNCGRRTGIKTAKKPAKLIPRSKFSSEFWQFVIEEKYWLQRPMNRVRVRIRSLGVQVSLGTLTNGLHLLYQSHIFEIVYEAILERSRLASQWHMDETGWKVFLQDNAHWYMWVAISADTCVFVLDPRRSNEVIQEYFNNVSEGIIICDRHSAYKCFGKNNTGFLIAFCWVHQRRDFIKLKDGYAEYANWSQSWLERIDALTAQNKVRVAAINTAEQFKVQDSILRLMIDQMKEEIKTQLASKGLHEEQIARLNSLQTHWPGLTVFIDHPHVAMSNNEAERALRDAVLGRKSYYGSRSQWSGQLTSWLFTIFATLEKNDIEPHRWMTDYLKACADNGGKHPKDLYSFLPWNYKKIVKPVPETNTENNKSTVTWPVKAGSTEPGELISVAMIPEPALHQNKPPPSG